MENRSVLTNSILWAAAILAAALLHGPTFLWLLALPSLATMALLVNHRVAMQAAKRNRAC